MMKMKRCLIVTGGTIDIAFAKDFSHSARMTM